MPETIHVPPMAPMSSRMTMAEAQLATLLDISASSCSHLSRPCIFPISTLTAVASKSDT